MNIDTETKIPPATMAARIADALGFLSAEARRAGLAVLAKQLDEVGASAAEAADGMLPLTA